PPAWPSGPRSPDRPNSPDTWPGATLVTGPGPSHHDPYAADRPYVAEASGRRAARRRPSALLDQSLPPGHRRGASPAEPPPPAPAPRVSVYHLAERLR